MEINKTKVRNYFLRYATLAATAAAWSFYASAAPNQQVMSRVAGEKAGVVDTLRDLVAIESGSRDREGLDRIADLLEKRLKAAGGKVEVIDPNSEITRMQDTPPTVGKVVVARFEGTGTRRILLLGHMDTVYPRGTLAKRPFRVEGNRAFGPGIADDKGGIAVILHALGLLKSLGFSDYKTLTVSINGDEEISTPGARKLIERLGSEHDYVLSCEPTLGTKDNIALATSGIGAAILNVKGRAAHAGVNPEDGRNALYELANRLLLSRDLSDSSKGVKFNWTIASAGTTRNVITEQATAQADVRVQRVADYDWIERQFRERIAAIKPLIPDTKVEAGFERRRPPLEVTDANRALARKAQAIYAELGKTLGVDETGKGGGTDAAFAALSGKSAVAESFGLAGYGYHSSDEEYVELDSIEPRLYLLVRLIMDLGAER
ncbi:MAG: M20/M25/M40 family metallo-hydrolase [Proteobacteria bacterium]|nr:M20/M25/M40 family metallo-hydrolase [Pseudomonadota bacterium]